MRRAAEQELFDLANRARSAEVWTARGVGGMWWKHTNFSHKKPRFLVGKCPAIFREKNDGECFF